MGASGNEIQKTNKIAALLISFANIKEFSKDLNSISNKKGDLSSIFISFIKDQSRLKLKIEEFKNLLDRNFDYKIDNLIEYILNTLNDELKKKQNNTNLFDENNKANRNPSIEDFLKNYMKNNDSIIQKLFFGIKEIKLKCPNGDECDKNFEIIKFQKFSSPEKESEIDIKTLVKNLKSLKTGIVNCQNSPKNTNHLIETNIIDLPEIFILYLDKRKNCKINYYLECQFFDIKYNLICFISNKNENNQIEEQNNVFYLVNRNWFIYKIEENKKIKIRDITKINGNPLVVFYQKDRTLFNKFYKYIANLLKDKENILELSNQHIIPEIGYENYYILNKDWFNKIIKIYEPENKYSDNGEIINSFKEVTNITKTKIRLSEFNERIKIICDENLFKIDYKKFDINSNNEKISYPDNFVLIKESILNNILKELNISNDIFQKYLYPVILGENLLFIKDKENSKKIHVCFLNKKNEFKVGVILKYIMKNQFEKELKKYISNKGGLEYYYQERKLKINLKTPQKIINREYDEIGVLINIINLNEYINPYKFSNLDDIMISGEKNAFHMDIFEKLLKDSKIYMSKFSNNNYGNNNQLNMTDEGFWAKHINMQNN